ncbi:MULTISPECIES: hypothetical protein [Bacillus amyloliquefaciens group]|uniref:hypothetical protein n=1 Tax=Bacillus amyloliquefaciens group TaxID=1938374 RepID=UPI00073CA181|nr:MULTISPECIES: hypothetical protein [Bacillus amyloliquefaciens group]KTF59106.1 hypothetical protein AR691_17640 [Bacillus amyloliquefaciens]
MSNKLFWGSLVGFLVVFLLVAIFIVFQVKHENKDGSKEDSVDTSQYSTGKMSKEEKEELESHIEAEKDVTVDKRDMKTFLKDYMDVPVSTLDMDTAVVIFYKKDYSFSEDFKEKIEEYIDREGAYPVKSTYLNVPDSYVVAQQLVRENGLSPDPFPLAIFIKDGDFVRSFDSLDELSELPVRD